MGDKSTYITCGECFKLPIPSKSQLHTVSMPTGVRDLLALGQLMTASMPTIIGRNITGIRPTHDCFCANLGHIMTAFMPTLGLTA